MEAPLREGQEREGREELAMLSVKEVLTEEKDWSTSEGRGLGWGGGALSKETVPWERPSETSRGTSDMRYEAFRLGMSLSGRTLACAKHAWPRLPSLVPQSLCLAGWAWLRDTTESTV